MRSILMWHLRELPVHGGAGKRLVHSFAIGWSPTQPTCPLVTDASYDPELLSDPPPPLLSHISYPSSVLLSVSVVGSLFHFLSIVLHCLHLLMHHPNGVPCRFKVRSDSLCGPCRLTLWWSLVRHTSAVFNTCKWCVWFLPFLCTTRLICEGEFWNSP